MSGHLHTVIDQMGRTVIVPQHPIRIVSLVPSQTELLYDLGLEKEVVGITKFCIHPSEWAKTKTKVGGTKNINLDTIRWLNPDLIIGNKEENSEKDILRLQQQYSVWMSDVHTLPDALAMIRGVGEITGKNENAIQICDDIENEFSSLVTLKQPRKILYLIWQNPWMAAGQNTFIHDMLSRLGFENVLETERYPKLEEAEVISLDPDVIFLSSEPYPFKEKHRDELKEILPHTPIFLVDGEMFSWYGSRLRQAKIYFERQMFAWQDR